MGSNVTSLVFDDQTTPRMTFLITALLIGISLFIHYGLLRWWSQPPVPGIPHVSYWLPFIGSGNVYFQSPVKFSRQYAPKHNDEPPAHTMYAFGRTWLKVYDKRDIESLLTASEKDVSFLEGYQELAGPALPKPNKSLPEDVQMKFAEAVSATPVILHALRPQIIKAWIPMIQEVLRQAFQDLSNPVAESATAAATATGIQDMSNSNTTHSDSNSDFNSEFNSDSGTLDLFPWCRDLISAITVRVLLGDSVAREPALLHEFVLLFHQADPESGFTSPSKAVGTLLEVAVRGERHIYTRIRQLLFPLVDEEIRRCIESGRNVQGDQEHKKEEVISCSVLRSMVETWFTRKLKGDVQLLKAARTRITNDLFNFFFAAYSNSFGMAAWVLFHILRNTNGIGDVLKTEMQNVDNNTPDATAGMPQLELAILEIARLYTPGDCHRLIKSPWIMPSTGITIPQRTAVLINMYTTMRDPSAFQNPLDLDLARYSPGREEHKAAGCMFMPFGYGAHPCAGKRFALLEIALFISEALRCFDLQLVEDESWGSDELTNISINVEKHPPLDLAQAGFIWRPAKPIMIHYKRKSERTL